MNHSLIATLIPSQFGGMEYNSLRLQYGDRYLFLDDMHSGTVHATASVWIFAMPVPESVHFELFHAFLAILEMTQFGQPTKTK